MCKWYNRYVAAPEYHAMQLEQRTDSLLLSQLLIEVFPKNDFDTDAAMRRSELMAQFLDLLKGPVERSHAARIPLCRSPRLEVVPPDVVEEVFARFGNNNFVVHSHLNSYAHGVFPLASRLFNHSCVPNCAAKFIITSAEMVKMEIVALRHIEAGEEVRTTPPVINCSFDV